MQLNDISEVIVDEALRLHTQIGPGLFESVYEVVLAHRLQKGGLTARRQVPIEIRVDGLLFQEGFRADIIVNECVLLEVKSTELNHPVHAKQLLTYLLLTGKSLGLLLNFGQVRLKGRPQTGGESVIGRSIIAFRLAQISAGARKLKRPTG